eukprot:Skav217024  [mRNA]  locus=scaffold1803:300256:303259:- [translate_table: standard]
MPSAIASVTLLLCFGGHVGAAEVLLKAKADPNVRAEDGSTPLHGAAERGHVQVVELLLASSVNWQSAASGGRTPLHVAAERGFADVAEESAERHNVFCIAR